MNDVANTLVKNDMLDIFHSVLAAHDDWSPLKSRESAAGFRDVFVYQNQYLIKTYTIEAPNLIWAVRNEQGELVAVEISDAHAHEFVVRFVQGELG